MKLVTHTMPTKEPGRNDICPCGSLRKYKRCCLVTKMAKEQAARDRRTVKWRQFMAEHATASVHPRLPPAFLAATVLASGAYTPRL